MSQTNTLPSVSIHDTTPEDRWRTVIPHPSVWIGGREYLYVDSGGPGHSTIELVEVATQEKLEVEQQFANRMQTLKSDLDAQVQQLAGALDNLIQQQVLERQASATQQLLASNTAKLPALQLTALQFFGTTPLDKSIIDFLRVVEHSTARDTQHQAWLASFQAAYEAKLTAHAIDHLTTKAKALEVAKRFAANEVKRAQRLDQKNQIVDLLLANLDLARHNHEVSSRQLQESLDTVARHDLESPEDIEVPLHGKALESQLAALLHTHRAHNLALNETQKYAIQLHAQHQILKSALKFAPPRNTRPSSIASANDLLQKSAQVLAAQDQQRQENLRLSSEFSKRVTAAISRTNDELARIAALGGSEIPQRPYTYRLPTDSTSRVQVITPSAVSMSSFAVVGTALGTALRAARPVMKGRNRVVLEAALLLLFSTGLDHGGRYGISSPLKELLPDFNPQDVIDSIGKYLEVPVRLISGMIDENSSVQAVGTDVEGVPGGVPVRQATWDAAQGAYSFVTDGPGPITVLWTPQGEPVDSSTALPAEEQPQRLYPGIISVPSTPTVLTLPSTDDLHFNDYIVTFPVDSGLEPVYIMFKSPRDYAGVATGAGQNISGIWLATAGTPEGSPIPSRIADQLRGRTFSNWDRMREAIWKAAAADAELSQEFIPWNIERMREGLAPIATTQEHNKSEKSFELHHVHQIAKGGAVYDIDNIVVMTPKQHAEAHKGGSQQ